MRKGLIHSNESTLFYIDSFRVVSELNCNPIFIQKFSIIQGENLLCYL